MTDHRYTSQTRYEAPRPRIAHKGRFVATIMVILLVILASIWGVTRMLAHTPTGPAFRDGSTYEYTFPFKDEAMQAKFTREASAISSDAPLYATDSHGEPANIGGKYVTTVYFPPGAFDATNPIAFKWGGYRFIPAFIAPHDSRELAQLRDDAKAGDASVFDGKRFVMVGLSEDNPIIDAKDGDFAQITGLYYWTSSNLDQRSGRSAPIILVGAAHPVGESSVVSPMLSYIPKDLHMQRAGLDITVKRVEFAGDQTRVLLAFDNELGKSQSWAVSGEEATFLLADGKAVPLETPDSVADDQYADVVPIGISEKYLIFGAISAPSSLALTMPEPGAQGSMTVDFDTSNVIKAAKGGQLQ